MPILHRDVPSAGRRVRRARRVVLATVLGLVAAFLTGVPEVANAATTRTRVTFTVGGTQLVGYHYAAATGTARPVVVMGHGFGLLQSTGLQPFAERFAAAGFDALTFDYRYFGESGGSPRELLDVPSQIDDYTGAVAAAKTLPGVDPAKVVVWGTSLAGGHALQTAAHHPVAAVIAQVPQVSGLSTLSGIPVENLPWLGLAAGEDLETVATGTAPRYIPITARPGQFAALSQPGALEGFRRLTAGTSWVNRETGRTVAQIPFYSPEMNASKITVPTLVVTATKDNIHPPQAARDLARQRNWAHTELAGSHWDVYRGGATFEANVAAQLAFLDARF